MDGKTPGYWNIWWTLSTIFVGLGVLAALLEILGVFGDAGLALSLLGIGLGLYFGLTALTRSSVRDIREALTDLQAEVRDGFGATRAELRAGFAPQQVTLERIASVLDERLPGPGSRG